MRLSQTGCMVFTYHTYPGFTPANQEIPRNEILGGLVPGDVKIPSGGLVTNKQD
jgi:hypothetical protein